ncbi:MAG: serine hydrolase domain-containing protein [Paracoccaceae bacterium]
MNSIATGLFAGLFALSASTAFAADLARGDPGALGFDAGKLAAIDAAVQAKIDKGAFPGAVVLVAREGKIAHLGVMGARTEGGEPMTEDSIFRIYSMTKPITSVAAMMLVEEGRLDLSFPVHAYLPAFKEMQVVTADGGTEPARRAMTVQDLMMHTAGLTYGFFGAGPARDALNEKNVENGGFTNLQIADILASLPLEHHPGEVWEYSRATDLLGAVIETVEGKSLGEVLDARIFTPLGMGDTGFWSDDKAQQVRMAEAKADDMKIGNLDMFDPKAVRAFESGGGGLVSTAHDYARFAQMLLNGGELDGARLLSPATVAYMTGDHMAARGIKPGKYYLPGAGYGFGLGFGVRTGVGGAAMGSVGEYNWGGAAGTYYWADPEEEMFVVYMMQSPRERVGMRSLLRNMVYGSMTESEAFD